MQNTRLLGRFVGEWLTEATHPAVAGALNGTASFAWLEGNAFLVWRGHIDDARFPDSMAVIGDCANDRGDAESRKPEKLAMHYFDSRGVYRLYDATIAGDTLSVVRDTGAFPQRMRLALADDDRRIDVSTQLRRDGAWVDDLQMTMRRR